MPFGVEKLEWLDYPTLKIFLKIWPLASRIIRSVRDRRTDGQTGRQRDGQTDKCNSYSFLPYMRGDSNIIKVAAAGFVRKIGYRKVQPNQLLPLWLYSNLPNIPVLPTNYSLPTLYPLRGLQPLMSGLGIPSEKA